MPRDVIIGIDAGTSLIKTVAFTRDGRQLGDYSLPNSYSASAGGHVEQDMLRTWNDTVAALRGLAAAVPDMASRIAAVAVTGQGDGTWLIDYNGNGLWDGTSIDRAVGLGQAADLPVTGNWLSSGYTP